jgi:6-phosphogluconolactonase
MTSLARDFMSDSELLYVGSYTDDAHREGIHVVRMDSRSGELRLMRSMNAGPNPSFLCIHPQGRALYAVNEIAEHDGQHTGTVRAFAIADDGGSLTSINVQSSGGRGPCYVSVDRSGRAVLVANYDSGSVALLPIDAAGALGAATSVAQQSGHGPNTERQEAPHAHCIVAHPANHYALAADLGADRVFVYELNAAAGSLRHHEAGDAAMRAGAGPRHIAFHPLLPLVFVVSELDSTVTTLQFDAEHGVLSPIGSISTVPANWNGTSYAADIHVAPLGNALYVSNRGHNSIAVFSIAASTGMLRLEQSVSTEGDWPRNFSVDPTGRWLLAANQKSGSIVVFARDQATGRLSPGRRRLELPSPVCLRFRAHAGVVT